DPKVWIKANPNLGISVNVEDLENKCRKAKASTQSQGEFRTKHCNQWIASESAWMDMTQWNACGDPSLRAENFAHEECMIGMDAAFKSDIFAKVKVFRRDDHYYAFGEYWVPKPKLEEKALAHISGWALQGLIHAVDDEVIDIGPIKEALRHDAELHVVKEVPFDPAQLTQFATEMIGEGFEMVEIRPTVNNFSEPMKQLGDLVLRGNFHHNGDPVLAWMIGNVIFHRDEKDNIYPKKDKHNQWKKIDGAIALIMALARMLAPKESDLITQAFVEV
ncbi:MAG: terminase TerL endonuclease subunit, partial [Burkholderiales bacterium]